MSYITKEDISAEVVHHLRFDHLGSFIMAVAYVLSSRHYKLCPEGYMALRSFYITGSDSRRATALASTSRWCSSGSGCWGLVSGSRPLSDLCDGIFCRQPCMTMDEERWYRQPAAIFHLRGVILGLGLGLVFRPGHHPEF